MRITTVYFHKKRNILSIYIYTYIRSWLNHKKIECPRLEKKFDKYLPPKTLTQETIISRKITLKFFPLIPSNNVRLVLEADKEFTANSIQLLKKKIKKTPI